MSDKTSTSPDGTIKKHRRHDRVRRQGHSRHVLPLDGSVRSAVDPTSPTALTSSRPSMKKKNSGSSHDPLRPKVFLDRFTYSPANPPGLVEYQRACRIAQRNWPKLRLDYAGSYGNLHYFVCNGFQTPFTVPIYNKIKRNYGGPRQIQEHDKVEAIYTRLQQCADELAEMGFVDPSRRINNVVDTLAARGGRRVRRETH